MPRLTPEERRRLRAAQRSADSLPAPRAPAPARRPQRYAATAALALAAAALAAGLMLAGVRAVQTIAGGQLVEVLLPRTDDASLW